MVLGLCIGVDRVDLWGGVGHAGSLAAAFRRIHSDNFKPALAASLLYLASSLGVSLSCRTAVRRSFFICRIVMTNACAYNGTMLIEKFFLTYVRSRTDWSRNTASRMRAAAADLAAFYGAKRLRTITPAHADRYHLHLKEQGLAVNTVRIKIAAAKQLFGAAKRQRLIDANPFEGIASSPVTNESRTYFVTQEVTQRLLKQIKSRKVRLIVALVRYAGLRCPSEVALLRWSDIDWERGRMTVSSPKTAGCGRNRREVPIFPELYLYLQRSYLKRKGESCVPNPGTYRWHVERALCKLGIKPWPKLFQNMRSSRQTELCEQFPPHVVCKWLGNSPLVALKHYLQATDSHFERAIGHGYQERMADRVGTVCGDISDRARVANEWDEAHATAAETACTAG